MSAIEAQPVATQKAEKQKEVFYSAATDTVIQFRTDLSQLSFEKAHNRLLLTKRLREDDALVLEDDKRVYDLYQHDKDLILNLSQFGDERPLNSIRYSVDGNLLATSSLSPAVKVWDVQSLECKHVYRGHLDRVTSVAWQQQESTSIFASTSADGHCIVWDGRKGSETEANNNDSDNNAMDVEDESSQPQAGAASSSASAGTVFAASRRQHYLHKFEVNKQSVAAACEFHPYMHHALAVASHDFSWRLYDLNVGQEMLLQDGHVRECTALGFHGDGSLIMSGDAGGVALLWDLRSGQMIQGFQGHIKKISSVSFNANGYQAATGSLDNTVKIWDLRKRKILYTLPAHSNIISEARYSKSGELLLTSSFDGTLKLWSARDFHLIRTLAGHNGKVMSCDFAADEKHIASVGFDRTIKLWAHKDEF